MDNRISPCMGCNRVKDPRDCENKNCQLWQRWFIARWDGMRRSFLSEPDKREKGCGAWRIGIRQPKPSRIPAYFHQDPCAACVCDREFCQSPCPSRTTWEQTRKDVFL